MKKDENNIKRLGYNIMCAIYAYQGFQKEKKWIRGLKMYLKKLWLKLPKLKERNIYDDSGSTESSKQDEPKQTYSRTYYNKNDKN